MAAQPVDELVLVEALGGFDRIGQHLHTSVNEAFGIYDTVRHDTIWLDKA